jgi:hypothetical protein
MLTVTPAPCGIGWLRTASRMLSAVHSSKAARGGEPVIQGPYGEDAGTILYAEVESQRRRVRTM